MSFWNYRIVKRQEGRGEVAHGLFEVFYDETKPIARTVDPIDFDGYETPQELISALETALEDARRYPVLDDLVKWPGFEGEDEEGP